MRKVKPMHYWKITLHLFIQIDGPCTTPFPSKLLSYFNIFDPKYLQNPMQIAKPFIILLGTFSTKTYTKFGFGRN